jgi:hypothetical protein
MGRTRVGRCSRAEGDHLNKYRGARRHVPRIKPDRFPAQRVSLDSEKDTLRRIRVERESSPLNHIMARPRSVFLRASLQLSYRWAAPSAKQYAPLIQRLYSTSAPTPKSSRGGSKVFKSADDAVADIEDGAVLLSAGFGLCGVAGA